MTPRPNFMPNAVFALFLLFLSACLSPSASAPTPTAAPTSTVTGTAAPTLTPTPAPTETPTLLPTPTPVAVTAEAWQEMPQADREAWFSENAAAIGVVTENYD